MSASKLALVSLLKKLSYKEAPKGEMFKLASGQESPYFIDVKKAALTFSGHLIIAQAAHEALYSKSWAVVDAVAGVALGGCSLASALVMNEAHAIYPFSKRLGALYVRKDAKDHGTGVLVEGNITPDMTAIIFEDVITTGFSTCAAIGILNNAGVKTTGVIAVVDRLEGGKERIARVGLPVIALTTIDDLR